MAKRPVDWSRRRFLQGVAWGTTAFTAPGAFADLLTRTPSQTEGPFYPDKLPLDTDNDLLVVNDALTPGVGEITHLGGRVLDANGTPLRNVVVEIWQVDGKGVYLHSKSGGAAQRDSHFQGFGRFLTGSKGEYYFRTVKPVAYPGRTPHIHFKIRRADQTLLTTQMYVKGEPQNARDGILQGIRDEAVRESVLVDFRPLAASRLGELEAKFDIVLGVTPDEGATSGESRS